MLYHMFFKLHGYIVCLDPGSTDELAYMFKKYRDSDGMLCSGKMTSSNWSIFCVTGHLYEEFTGDRWIPHTKASYAELWCFPWSAPEETVE